MSNKLQQAEALKKIFEKVKYCSIDKDGYLEDFNFASDLDEALFNVGKEKIYELKDEVYPYLNNIDPSFRETAIRALGFGWGKGLNLPEFRDIAYKMWLNDPNDRVKEAALDEWITYYAGSKEPVILKCLYNIIYSNQCTIHARVVALLGFIEVAHAVSSAQEVRDIFDLEELAGDTSKIRFHPINLVGDDHTDKVNRMKEQNIKLFNAAINKGHYYNKINSIMQKYVPNWQSKRI